MELSPELIEKADKFFTLHRKVELLHSNGTLAKDKYERYKVSLTERAVALKKDHEAFIDKKILDLTSGIINIETMSSDIVSQSLYQARYLEMSTRRDEFQTEKSWVNTVDNEEYLTFIKNELMKNTEKSKKVK
jgi:hypothetical protein